MEKHKFYHEDTKLMHDSIKIYYFALIKKLNDFFNICKYMILIAYN